MSDVSRPQSRAIFTIVALLATVGAAIGACTSYQRANGEGCLKDADCLTNYCQAQVCSSPPTTLVGSSYEEAGPDTGSAVVEAGADTSLEDAASDAPADAGADG